jgi:phosphoglycerate dehydrogenase-like enzyme
VNKPIRLLLDSGSRRFVADVNGLPEAGRFEILSYVGKGEDGLRELITQADAVYISQHGLSAELIQSAPTLRFIQKYGLNCKNIDIDAATRRGIPVATVPLFRHATVAEHALGLILACARKIVPSHRAVGQAVYQELGLEPMTTSQREHRPNWAQIAGISELKSASVGIMGLGDIGMEIAKRCRAFDMKIFYHQRQRHRFDVEEGLGVTFLPFRELLERVDYLVLILPHTKETEGLIGAEQLAWMKPTATLINVARGAVVDEKALADALASGRLAMAGLDVYREEPLPASSPLASMPNVVLTPHTGGGSYQFREADRALGLANIVDYFDGKPPSGVINPH